MLDKIKYSDWVYDIETYYDLFSACFVHAATGTRYIFEVSDRVNQSRQFVEFLYWQRDLNARQFGYNNVHFDWPVCDHLIQVYNHYGTFEPINAKEKQEAIFAAAWGDWTHSVPLWERLVVQGDLLKIHHFDNQARRTSLKKLEINMRSHKVIDLPYDPNQPTTSAQKDEIIAYMCHDVNETLRFFHHSLDQIAFRDSLIEKYTEETVYNGVTEYKCALGDVLNMSDGKIGEKIMIRQIEASGTPCFEKRNGKKEPIQTVRGLMNLGDVISPKVMFNHPDFGRMTNFIGGSMITPSETKGFFGQFYTYVFPDGHLETRKRMDKDDEKAFIASGGRVIKAPNGDGRTACLVDNFQYDFGTGGIHGSMSKTAVHADDEWEIWDWDVASYYPNLAITHGWYPEHLSSSFCDVYLESYKTRQTYAKGTPENAMWKLGLNVPYGLSNSHFSPFYDSQYTMSVTINGQLLLCMLAEWLTHTYHHESGTLYSISDCVQMLQINTDGLTIRVKKSHIEWMHSVCKIWQEHTGLVLESAEYKSMFMRDVNSYMAIKTNGKVKRIGNYRIETPLDNPHTREFGWHQDHSALVVRKAVNAYLVDRTPIADFIMNHRDPFDFQCSVKVGKTSMKEPCYLVHGKVYENGDGEKYMLPEDRVQNTSRYYISTDGAELMKDMRKQNAKKRSLTSVEAGWTVTMTNDMDHFRWDNVNWFWYIDQAKKLIEGFDHG